MRRYGDVGIFGKKSNDHIINVLPSGSERPQFVELTEDRPLLLLSVYLHCKGSMDRYLAFADY